MALLLFGVGIGTGLLNPVGRMLSDYEVFKNVIPEDVPGSDSVYRRVDLFRQSLEVVASSPLLGTGLGSTLVFVDPDSGELWGQEFVEVGWAYMLVKFGILGTLVFVWLLFKIGSSAVRKQLLESHAGLLLVFLFFVLYMVVDAKFVIFLTAAWAGITCGFLHTMNQSAPDLPVRRS
jgi:O-antigen ligase